MTIPWRSETKEDERLAQEEERLVKNMPSRSTFSVLLVALIALSGSAFAGYLSSDSDALVSGSSDYSYSSASGNAVLSGSVEFAVYDRSQYSGLFSAVTGGPYIYVYQIFNDQGANNVAVDHFSIGLEGATAYTITSMDDVADADDVAPTYSYFAGGKDDPTGAVFGFLPSEVDGGQGALEGNSEFLIFTSDSEWTWSGGSDGSGSGSGSGSNYAAISGSGLGTNMDFSVPEPSTIALLGAASMLVIRKKKA